MQGRYQWIENMLIKLQAVDLLNMYVSRTYCVFFSLNQIRSTPFIDLSIEIQIKLTKARKQFIILIYCLTLFLDL